MIIRKAKINDINQIAKNNIILAYEIEKLQLDFDKAYLGSKNVFNENNDFYLIADENKKIIGQMYITSEWSDWRNKNIWWIHRIYIHKDFRNKGIFKKMLKYLKEKASKSNVFVIRLYVHESNKSAINIYNKIGLIKTPFLIYQDKTDCL